jgi:hypothetical protein
MNTAKAKELCDKISGLVEGHTGDEAMVALTMVMGGVLGSLVARESDRNAQIDSVAAMLKAALKTHDEPRLQ